MAVCIIFKSHTSKTILRILCGSDIDLAVGYRGMMEALIHSEDTRTRLRLVQTSCWQVVLCPVRLHLNTIGALFHAVYVHLSEPLRDCFVLVCN